MRCFSLALSFVAASALVASAFAGEATAKLPWDGLGQGSYILMKTTSKTVMTGMPADAPAQPEETTQTRTTLSKITDKAYTLKLETKIGADWIAQEVELSRVATPEATKPEPKPESLGTEKITVDDTEIECKKVRVVEGKSTRTSWTHEKHGMVKMEATSPDGDQTSELVKLAETIKVKDEDVECQVMKTTYKSPMLDMTMTAWTSDTIPGSTVKTETVTKTKMGDITTTQTSVEELVEFEKK